MADLRSPIDGTDPTESPAANVPDSSKPRVAVLVNILTPYRVPVYNRLAREFEVRVFTGRGEAHRTEWSGAEQALDGVRHERVASVAIPFRDLRRGGRVHENRYLHFSYGLWSALRRFDPDLVLSVEMGFRSLMALIYGKLRRRPVWVWWGGTPHTQRSIGPLRRVIRQIVVPMAERWVSYGDEATAYLRTLGIDRTAVEQIQNCVDESQFSPIGPRAYDLKPKPVFLVVGRLVALKGVDLYLRAAAEAQDSGAQFTTLIAGDGPDRPHLERLATELALRNTHFVGRVASEDMPGIYRSGDALVFPTLDDAWGLVINEALWSGLPVVASPFAGASSEILQPENIVDPWDTSAFAQKIQQLAAEPVPPADVSRVRRIDDVSAQLVNAIRRRLDRLGAS